MTELNIFTRLSKQAATIKPTRISCNHLLRTNILRICLVITRPALCLVCMLFNGFDQKLSIGFIQRKHERKKKKTALLFTTWRFNHLGCYFLPKPCSLHYAIRLEFMCLDHGQRDGLWDSEGEEEWEDDPFPPRR